MKASGRYEDDCRVLVIANVVCTCVVVVRVNILVLRLNCLAVCGHVWRSSLGATRNDARAYELVRVGHGLGRRSPLIRGRRDNAVVLVVVGGCLMMHALRAAAVLLLDQTPRALVLARNPVAVLRTFRCRTIRTIYIARFV